MRHDAAMPFHAIYNSRRATPPQPSVTAVWGELLRRYIKPELNAKASPEEVGKGLMHLFKMGYTVVDSETDAIQPEITPADLPEVMAVMSQPKAPKPERKPRPAPAAAKGKAAPAAAAKKEPPKKK
jgi:hypothetical protein